MIKGDGVFIISDLEKKKLISESSDVEDFIKPIYKNSDLKKWGFQKRTNLHIIYIKDEGEPINLPEPLKRHFSEFKDILVDKKKNCFKNAWLKKIVEPWLHRGNYFVLFYPRERDFFESPKIVNSRRAKSNIFALEDKGYYEQSDIVLANLKPNSPVSLKYLLALLNSKLYFVWLYYKGKRKGEQLELFQKPLKEIPIKIAAQPSDYERLVDKILEGQNEGKLIEQEFEQLNNLVYELYDLTEDEINVVEKIYKS